MGGFGQVQLAEQAAAITGLGANSVPEAVQAWAFYIGRADAQAYALAGSTVTCDFEYTAQYNVAPQLPDGTYLYWNNITVSVSQTTPSITASGGDQLIACVDSVTSCSLTGAGVSTTTTIMECDQIATGIACTETAKPGENDFMFGAWVGTDVFLDDTGNNYMVGSPSGGVNTFKFGQNNVNNSGQDTVKNFRPGTDSIVIKTNLDGSGVTTPAGVAALCAASGANTVCSFGGGNTITILGQTSPASSWFTVN
jgi:hypothetical protein